MSHFLRFSGLQFWELSIFLLENLGVFSHWFVEALCVCSVALRAVLDLSAFGYYCLGSLR